MQKPTAATSTAVVRKKPAGGLKNQLGLLEVCAYPGSALSHVWAKRGESAVRIAHRKTGMAPKPGPEPVEGRALTWHLVAA